MLLHLLPLLLFHMLLPVRRGCRGGGIEGVGSQQAKGPRGRARGQNLGRHLEEVGAAAHSRRAAESISPWRMACRAWSKGPIGVRSCVWGWLVMHATRGMLAFELVEGDARVPNCLEQVGRRRWSKESPGGRSGCGKCGDRGGERRCEACVRVLGQPHRIAQDRAVRMCATSGSVCRSCDP
jgi:hypothetical protein